MSTDISVVKESINQAVSLAEQRGDLEPYTYSAVPRVTIPRDLEKGWQWESLTGTIKAGNSLEGIYLGHSNPEHTLWPYTGSGSGSPPYLRSNDGVIGYKTGEDVGDLDVKKIEAAKNKDGTYNWKDIEYCQWAEGKNGRRIPPRAKQTVRVCILPESGDPVIVSLPGTSIRYFKVFAGSNYAVPGGVAIALDLEEAKGSANSYVVAKTRVIERLEPEVSEKLARLYADRVSPLLSPKQPSAATGDKKVIDEVPF